MISTIVSRRNWVFDMDGTLTVAAHDFAAIKRDLGLSEDSPILEQLRGLPGEHAHALSERLDKIEHEIALEARPQDGAGQLLETLGQCGCNVGILTRNSHRNALATLARCRLDKYFDAADVLGREACDPKPSPTGVRALLTRWQVGAEDAVMVGDYLFDLLAGRGAGVATVYFDPTGEFTHADHADACVERLGELTGLIESQYKEEG